MSFLIWKSKSNLLGLCNFIFWATTSPVSRSPRKIYSTLFSIYISGSKPVPFNWMVTAFLSNRRSVSMCSWLSTGSKATVKVYSVCGCIYLRQPTNWNPLKCGTMSILMSIISSDSFLKENVSSFLVPITTSPKSISSFDINNIGFFVYVWTSRKVVDNKVSGSSLPLKEIGISHFYICIFSSSLF